MKMFKNFGFAAALVFAIFSGANAVVIDFIELPNGTFDVVSEGGVIGRGVNRTAAERLARNYSKDPSRKINWQFRNTNGGATGGNLPTVTGNTSQVPANPTTTPGTTTNTTPAQRALPAGETPKALPPHETPAPPKPSVAGNAVRIAGGVLSVVGGTAMVLDSGSNTEEKVSWGDVAEGAVGGAMVSQGLIALNVIPVAGNIAYGVAVAAGTLLGAAKAGSRMFSETDCATESVRGVYVCCNVSKLTRLDNAIYANIGDEMFGVFPYVHTCMQGKNKFESNWFKARFLDDHWDKNGEIKFCSGYEMPTNSNDLIQPYAASAGGNGSKVCWKWECADEGMVRSGSKCVPYDDVMVGPVLPKNHDTEDKSSDTSTASDTVLAAMGGTLDAAIVSANAIKAGDPCPTDRLPQYATAGKYIKNGTNPDTGLDKFICAATACKSGTYIVVNDAGASMGWCTGAITCPDGQRMNVINGTKTNRKCVASDGTAVPVLPVLSDDITIENDDLVIEEIDFADDSNLMVEFMKMPTKCEEGAAGYQIFENKCLSTGEIQKIIAKRKADAVSLSHHRADDAYNKIKTMTDQFKVSVWRDAEGNFNTSRLVSDSIAGVVLGTTGGIITSNVIKKNQLKTGFENIQCTIGGQSVAMYGDEFTVGMK